MLGKTSLGIALLGMAAFAGSSWGDQGRIQTKVQRHDREIAELQRKIKSLETAARSKQAKELPKATMNMHDAAAKDSIPQLRFALNAGAKVDLKNAKGMTPLMAACVAGKIRAARYLLVNGASPKLQDKEGKSILELAKKGGSVDLLTLLVEYGAR